MPTYSTQSGRFAFSWMDLLALGIGLRDRESHGRNAAGNIRYYVSQQKLFVTYMSLAIPATDSSRINDVPIVPSRPQTPFRPGGANAG
jgi:hypothetical protein